ncbi:MAG: UPF0182 family protein [Parcubacteria group bacterium]|nr:UPF0182 family protein [Parcubacteria group bacterium]
MLWSRILKWCVGALVVVTLGGMVFGWYASWQIDHLWFTQLGYGEVFLTQFFTRIVLGVVSFLASLFFFTLLYGVVSRNTKPCGVEVDSFSSLEREELAKKFKFWWFFISVFFAVLVGMGATDSVKEFLLFRKSASFGSVDAILKMPIDFYVYKFPFLVIVNEWFLFLFVGTLFVLGIVWFLCRTPDKAREFFAYKGPGRGILSSLLFWGFIASFIVGGLFPAVVLGGLAIIFIMFIAGRTKTPTNLDSLGLFQPGISRALLLVTGLLFFDATAAELLARYQLVIKGSSNILPSTSWIDAHYFLSYDLALAFLFLLIGITFLIARHFSWKLHGGIVGGIVGLQIIFGMAVPGLITKFYVKPNEPILEKPYIEAHLTATKNAYNLTDVIESRFDPSSQLTQQAVDAASDTISNIRIWDYRAFNTANNQLQALKTYYRFYDADTDRYYLDKDQYRQVEISARELDLSQLPPGAEGRFIVPLTYTHGDGVVVAPVNKVSEEGRPVYVVRDIPPSSTSPYLSTNDPRIYFGEGTYGDLFLNTGVKEVDSEGKVDERSYGLGFPITNLFTKFMVSLRSGDWSNVLFSQYIKNDTEYVMHREIRDRVQSLAPYLTFDADPYPIIRNDGTLSWVLDGYTTTNSYPLSFAVDGQSNYPYGKNYIRNSVKAVVDATTGKTDFYVWDENDPILKSWEMQFPHSLKPKNTIPEDVVSHLRFPNDLFENLTSVYNTYHVRDADEFYNRQDVWSVPQETLEQGSVETMKSYYNIVNLPGIVGPGEFVLLRPVTPYQKDNMTALYVGRSDMPNTGRLMVYYLPKDRLVAGPSQIETRIDQDSDLSKDLTLWNQQGSQVVRGGLFVLPVGNTFLYVKSIYLQAKNNPIPELKLVVLATENQLAFGANTEEALQKLLAKEGKNVPEKPKKEK